MPDSDALKVKNVMDIADQLKRTEVLSKMLGKIEQSQRAFLDAYATRRNTLLEINALYRNQSYLDQNRTEWQTKSFIPLVYDAVERKTSILHQALWGNRVASPYSCFGRTYEDHEFAFSAENLLNNTVDRIGFYSTSEEGLRSTCKYGLGVYRYGWQRRLEVNLVREVRRDADAKVIRNKDNQPIYKFSRKSINTSQPFIRNVDIIDHLGFDPTAKSFDKWGCDFVYEVREETPETIYDNEDSGEYDKGSFDRLKQLDPHGIDALKLNSTDNKGPQIRRDEGVNSEMWGDIKPRYNVVDWFGWFDIDGDGKREFIRVICIPEKKLILAAYENILNEYPFVDIQYSRSLHSLTPWGIVDPVIKLQYEVNELHNQRGDGIKLKLNPQFLINVDKILEDNSYTSQPGAMHPFSTGDEPVGNAMKVLEFQNLESISVEQENDTVSKFSQVTGIADLNKVLGSSNKDTPATTVVSILNEQQAGNSMIVNGILERHGVLGSRVLKLLQLFGDEEFIIRSSGRQGLTFINESLENILGDFDVKVTTSTFFGNRQIELQYLIQLKPLWAQAQHIDQIELDRAILENILPKRVDQILNVPKEPLSAVDEQTLFIVGKGYGVKVNPAEEPIELSAKLRAHQTFISSEFFKKLDGGTQYLFKEYFIKLTDLMKQLQTQQQMQQVAAAKAAQNFQPDPSQPAQPGVNGNMGNAGNPMVRQMGNGMAPKPNNVPGM